MFETSSAMLEIFGGAPTPPSREKSSQKEKDAASLNAALASTAVYEAAIRQPVAPIENGVSRVEPETSRPEPSVSRPEPQPSQQVTLDVDKEQSSQSASVTFQQIPPTPPTVSANERPQFGRTNTLAREGVSRSEWEPVSSQTTATASSFQVTN